MKMNEKEKTGIECGIEWINSYEEAKKRLFLRVCDTDTHAKKLECLPHRDYDGLSVTCHIMVQMDENVHATSPVKKDLLERYGVPEEQLFNDAAKNAARMFPPKLMSMNDILGIPIGSGYESSLWVLTNPEALYGASALFYPGMMENLAEKFGGSYCVIPSSVHDVIILPDSDLEDGVDAAGLGVIIREINHTQLMPDERLSDNAYHYDAGTGRFGKA